MTMMDVTPNKLDCGIFLKGSNSKGQGTDNQWGLFSDIQQFPKHYAAEWTFMFEKSYETEKNKT